MKLKIPSFLTDTFVPDLEASNLLEYFLIAAVSSLLAIRAYLHITHFPQLGGDRFHIAHMLWGGLLMMVAMVIFTSFINRQSKLTASIIGGIGFGAFIDELGKFITADNNYFFQPTIALIYVIFVLIFLIIRYFSTITEYSSKTYTANAVTGLVELIISDLDVEEKVKALTFLKRSNQNDPLVKMLYNVLEKAPTTSRQKTMIGSATNSVVSVYSKIISIKILSKLLVIFFIFTTSLSYVAAVVIMFSDKFRFTTQNSGYFISSIVAGVFVVVSVYYYLKQKLIKSYENLQRATLVSIFLSQFFLFMIDQLSAIFWLILYITVYIILKRTIERARLRELTTQKPRRSFFGLFFWR